MKWMSIYTFLKIDRCSCKICIKNISKLLMQKYKTYREYIYPTNENLCRRAIDESKFIQWYKIEGVFKLTHCKFI